MSPKSTCVVLAVALFATTLACTPNVPFTEALIGKTFRLGDNCYRPVGYQVVKIEQEYFEYYSEVTRYYNCPERIIFNIHPQKPTITLMPHIVDRNSSSSEENERFCEEMQPPLQKVLKPRGSTSQTFWSKLKEAVKGVRDIRQLECVEDGDGVLQLVPGDNVANAKLEGLVAYMLGVGYRYGVYVE